MLCGLADGVDALVAQGLETRRVLLIGGAARSEAVQRIAPDLFGVPVVVPSPAEYVALGAARQAAWALAARESSDAEAPRWPPRRTSSATPSTSTPARGAGAYRGLREAIAPRGAEPEAYSGSDPGQLPK